MNDHFAFFFIVIPVCHYGIRCTINDFPPAMNIIDRVGFKLILIEMFHDLNLTFSLFGRYKIRHQIHLLNFFRICFGPCVIFTCCIISRILFNIH